MSARANPPITGRCYCGAITIAATRPPEAVAYCHCVDCRRAVGAPVSAVAAFDEATVTFAPGRGKLFSPNGGAKRWFCADCGSSVASQFDYLPGQIYVSLGLLDQAADLAPQMHAYESQRLPWLDIHDHAERFERTSRSRLNRAHGDARPGNANGEAIA